MPPRIVQQYYPPDCFAAYPAGTRQVRGRVLHHTAGSSLPTPKFGASWNKIFDKDGTIYNAVPREYAAHHDRATDRWRPSWVHSCPDFRVSDINYSSEGWEIVYAPQDPFFETPTPQQYSSLRWQLEQDYLNYGLIPTVGHGETDLQRWPTEPHNLDWARLGFHRTPDGYIWTPATTTEEPPMNPATDQEIIGWLNSANMTVNPETAIIKFVMDAFRQGPPPFGNWRGPAISDEYPATSLSGEPVIHQDFTAGIVEYNLATGGLGWVEVVAHPELIPPR